MSPHAHTLRLVLVALSPLTLACIEPEPVRGNPEQVIADAIDLDALERLDLEPLETEHAMELAYAEFYANEVAAEVFRSIDGGDPNATAEFPFGSLLVKRQLDANLEPTGVLTVLAKFEDGYHPGADDWYFAMINSEGEIQDDISGNGARVVFCVDCHQQLGENTDGVIGLLPSQLR